MVARVICDILTDLLSAALAVYLTCCQAVLNNFLPVPYRNSLGILR